MSVIVWDGVSLAVDNGATDGFSMWEAEKVWVHKGKFLTGAGTVSSILEMREWYKNGASPLSFPSTQRVLDTMCNFIVVDKTGLHRYEQTHIPIDHGFKICAFGQGKDFAYGALAMGATAEQAATIANKFSIHCGMGVSTYVMGVDND